MPFYRKEKKKKYPYKLICEQDEIYGSTDNPRRTITSIWKLYKKHKKYVCIDLCKIRKPEELCIKEHDNRQVTYTFKNKEINKEQFKQLLK